MNLVVYTRIKNVPKVFKYFTFALYIRSFIYLIGIHVIPCNIENIKIFSAKRNPPFILLNIFSMVIKISYVINMSMEIIYCVPRTYTFGLDC